MDRSEVESHVGPSEMEHLGDARSRQLGPGSSTRAPSPMEAIFRKTRKQNPQRTIDHFWQRFTIKNPGQVITVLPDNLYAKRAAAKAPKGVVPGSNAIASYEDAVRTCQQKVEKIAHACKRVNQKYQDVHFDIEFDLKMNRQDCLDGLVDPPEPEIWNKTPPGSVKRVEDLFEEPRFYINDATPGDVKQGRDGDCWFLAALCTLSNMKPLVERVCVARDEEVGVYGFVFHRDGEWISTIIDDKLYLIKPDYDERRPEDRYQWDELDRANPEEEYRKSQQTGSRALYFAQCSDQNETWLPLLEKAYAKAHGDFASISGGFVGEALEDLTGGVTTEIFTTDILDKERFWRDELMHVNKEFLFGCFTGLFGGTGFRRGIREKHAYSIMRVEEIDGERLVLLRNPWGQTEWTGAWSDGSKEWTPWWMQRLNHKFGDDGVFWISYKDLLRKFQHFDRTRLFGPKWTITQQWTSLNISWSVNYHDTKFTIDLKKGGPVVIVLSQLDDRYFTGLEGQYSFGLQFRVHKEGEKQYIVRSNEYYCMRRSVSAEIDLEPGRYSVLLKITADRNTEKPRSEEVVRRTCKYRRDKLLQIGLSYDLAHAKGQLFETEEQKKQRELRVTQRKAEQRRKNLEQLKRQRREQKAREKKLRKRQRRHEKKQAEKARKREVKRAQKAERKTQADRKPNGEKKRINIVVERAGSDKDERIDEFERVPRRSTDSSNPVILTPATDASSPDKTRHDFPNHHFDTYSDSDSDSSSSSSESDSDFDEQLDRLELQAEEHHDARSDRHAPPSDDDEDEDDEFAKDPWNAVCTVGLRVYSNDEAVSVEVVRPNEDQQELALDIDDSAVDAAPQIGKSGRRSGR